MKTYRGLRGADGICSVTVDCELLDRRTDLRNHSPTGFEWGYEGSGPAQLALAVLADHLGPSKEEEALVVYQEFKRTVIARLPQNGWQLTGDDIEEWWLRGNCAAALDKAFNR